MNTFFNESPQFNFSDSMSLHCNMVSVVISSIVMSSFSKCPSVHSPSCGPQKENLGVRGEET